MRLQLAAPDNTLLDGETYNGLVSMHGTTMIFLFVVPVLAGFGNYFVPLMIGARDMAFPRLNALSFWLLLAGGVVFYASIFFEPPQAGWTSYAPLSDDAYSPGGGIDAWIFLIHLTGLSLAGRRDQLRGHDPQHARARHELGPDAAVRVDDPRLQLPADRGAAGDRRRGHDAAHRPPLRHRLLRRGRRRRPDAVAAPVLVLRPPRGLHHDPARLRDDLGDPAGVRAQADLRLQGDRGVHGGHRLPGHARVGAPHVHHADRPRWCWPSSCSRRSRSRCRPGSRSSTGSPRSGAGTIMFKTPLYFAAALPAPVRDRRHLGRSCWPSSPSTGSSTTPTSSSPTSTTCCSAARCSASSPGSTTGSRRCPAG